LNSLAEKKKENVSQNFVIIFIINDLRIYSNHSEIPNSSKSRGSAATISMD